MNFPIFYIFFFIIFSIFIKKLFNIKNVIQNFIFNLIFSLLLFSYFNYNSHNYMLNIYFILSVNIFFLWFYYTFIEGFSSKLIILIYKFKDKNKIKKSFLDKQKKNIIIADRLFYLRKGKYLKQKNSKFFLTNKTKIIAFLHNFISKLLNIKKSGGIDS